jgi:hypothetical protein
LGLRPVNVIDRVTIPWATVGQKICCLVRGHDNDTDIDVSEFNCPHEMRQVIRQQIAPRRDLKFDTHANLGSVVEYALGPIDSARLDLPPMGIDALETAIEHFSHSRCTVGFARFLQL